MDIKQFELKIYVVEISSAWSEHLPNEDLLDRTARGQEKYDSNAKWSKWTKNTQKSKALLWKKSHGTWMCDHFQQLKQK